MKESIFAVVFVFNALFCSADAVVKYAGPDIATLNSRWDWGVQTAKQRKFGDGFWIGYNTEQLMYKNEIIGSFYSHGPMGPALREILDGRASPEKQLQPQQRAKVIKEVGFLFRFATDGSTIERIEVSNLDLYFKLHDLPIIWLGKVDAVENINFLRNMYGKLRDEKLQEQLITAIGIHKRTETISILESLLSERSVRLRGQAAFWLGAQKDEKALTILKNFLPKEESEEVIDQAMAGMNEMESPSATQTLAAWADNGSNVELRKKAIFWLAQRAVQNVQDRLKDYAFKDKDTEIQKQAVIALAEMEHNEGVPQLIEIARTHPNWEVRKQAIIFLGESGDPRAKEALLKMLQK